MKVCNNTSEHDIVVIVTMSMAEWKCLRHYAGCYATSAYSNGVPFKAAEVAAKIGRQLDDTAILTSDKLFNIEE